MVKQVLINYFSSFRWSNIKQKKNNMQIWTFVYIIVIVSLSTNVSVEDSYGVRYFLYVVPLMFGVLSNELVAVRLPKIYYLAPMNKAQRTKYIYCCFGTKVCIPVFLGVISTLGMICFRVIPGQVVYALTIIVSLFSVQFATCISPEYFSSGLEEKRKRYKNNMKSRMPKGLNFYSVISVILGILMGIIFVVGAEKSDFAPENIAFRIGLWIAIALTLLVNAKLLSYVKPVLDNYIDYEMALYVNWEDQYVAKSNK